MLAPESSAVALLCDLVIMNFSSDGTSYRRVKTMTTALTLIQRLYQHRAWVNQHLLAAAIGLNDEQLRREFPIGQASVWKSLTHLYAAEYVWLAALQGEENALAPGDAPGHLPGNQLGADPMRNLDELREKWSALEKRWTDYLTALPAESLDDLVYRFSVAFNERFSSRRYDVLLHVCAHAQYTTAQVVNMLRQLGVPKLPPTMLIAMARQEAKKL
jgi:uncharacterized damage-inducible protein DinB